MSKRRFSFLMQQLIGGLANRDFNKDPFLKDLYFGYWPGDGISVTFSAKTLKIDLLNCLYYLVNDVLINAHLCKRQELRFYYQEGRITFIYRV